MEIGDGQLIAIFAALYALAEVIALTPLKSNSTFQLIFNILKKLREMAAGYKPPQKDDKA